MSISVRRAYEWRASPGIGDLKTGSSGNMKLLLFEPVLFLHHLFQPEARSSSVITTYTTAIISIHILPPSLSSFWCSSSDRSSRKYFMRKSCFCEQKILGVTRLRHCLSAQLLVSAMPVPSSSSTIHPPFYTSLQDDSRMLQKLLFLQLVVVIIADRLVMRKKSERAAQQQKRIRDTREADDDGRGIQ